MYSQNLPIQQKLLENRRLTACEISDAVNILKECVTYIMNRELVMNHLGVVTAQRKSKIVEDAYFLMVFGAFLKKKTFLMRH